MRRLRRIATPRIWKTDFAGRTTLTRGHKALFHRYCPKRHRIRRTRREATTEPSADPATGFPKVSVRENAKQANFSMILVIGSTYGNEIVCGFPWHVFV